MQNQPRTLVALLAHGDDETAVSPVLARYAREGVRVHMVMATDGAGGSGTQTYLQRSSDGPVGEALAKVRTAEARCAAAAIGAEEPIFLGFPDGKLGDYLGDRSLVARLTEQVAGLMARMRPDVVVTWGPDGGTGHPDHRMLSNIATQLQRTGAPGMPERLFYMYFPPDMFATLNPQRGAPPLLQPQPKYFTVHVPFTTPDLEAAQKAMTCHTTQFNPAMLEAMRPALAKLWNGRIEFIPAGPSMSGNDLFR